MNSTFAEINLNYLVKNYLNIRKKTSTKVMAVVKADAYGHGMLECAKILDSLEKNSPEYYGVALIKEAIELRKSTKIKKPILCFAPFDFCQINNYSKFKIIPTINSEIQCKNILKLKNKKKLEVQIKINTGMNRLGIRFDQAFEWIKKLSLMNNIIIDGIYTHFATSDEKDKTFAYLQLKRFKNLLYRLKNAGINYGLAHAANSGAILDIPESYLDMVRPGISLYGYYPSLDTTKSIKLQPVMSLYSYISTIHEIDKNESIGYGRIFIVNQKGKYGTVPIGYADGLNRFLSNQLNVIINNKLFEQVGRVSMDRITIKLDDHKVKIGSKVVLLGLVKNLEINAWDWASKLKTIPYEITCSITKRVERNFIFKS